MSTMGEAPRYDSSLNIKLVFAQLIDQKFPGTIYISEGAVSILFSLRNPVPHAFIIG